MVSSLAAADAILGDDAAAAHVMQACMLSYACFLLFPSSRGPSFFEQRLAWDRYVEKHSKRGTLKRRIRMSRSSFAKLLRLIYHRMIVEELFACSRGGPIIPELCLYCTLRWLAGGSYLDICDIAGVSSSSFYRVVWKTVRALASCKELEIKFPTGSAEIQRAVEGFESISFQSAIKNCALVLDGYLLRIKTPQKATVGNVRSYFSGHYQCYGVNIQAACDHHCRFVYFAFASPGVTADRYAVKHCSLSRLIEGLPIGICAIGDAAYEATEHMVPVFMGHDRTKKRNDNFNFYASQLRIRIEMAFGLMQGKWGILLRPLGSNLVNVKELVQCIARLHNWVITERIGDDVPTSHGNAYMPTVPNDSNGDPIDTDRVFGSLASMRGHSELRERMVDRVERLGLKRPASNRLKRTHNDISPSSNLI